jgi:hypothetical protein
MQKDHLLGCTATVSDVVFHKLAGVRTCLIFAELPITLNQVVGFLTIITCHSAKL